MTGIAGNRQTGNGNGRPAERVDSSRHQRQRSDGTTGTVSRPVTNGDSATEVRESEKTQHRTDPTLSAGNLRLLLLLVSIIVVGAAAGFVGSLFLPKQFAARAELQYNLSNSVPNELLREDRTLTTQLVLLTSRAVLAPVASANGMTPEDLAKHVSAEVLDSSEIIRVEVRDRTRERAQKLLTGVVGRYLTVANNNWQDPVRAYQENQLRDQQSQLDDVRKQLQVSGAAGQDTAALIQREQVLRTQLDWLQSQLSTGPTSAAEPPARVVTGPYQVVDQVWPRPLLAAAAGAAAAVVVAGFVVLIAARRRLRS